MTMRPFPTDKPQRESYGRQAVIRMRIDAVNYIIDLGDGLPSMGFHLGPKLLDPGEIVRVDWANEGPIWTIEPAIEPIGGPYSILVETTLNTEDEPRYQHHFFNGFNIDPDKGDVPLIDPDFVTAGQGPRFGGWTPDAQYVIMTSDNRMVVHEYDNVLLAIGNRVGELTQGITQNMTWFGRPAFHPAVSPDENGRYLFAATHDETGANRIQVSTYEFTLANGLVLLDTDELPVGFSNGLWQEWHPTEDFCAFSYGGFSDDMVEIRHINPATGLLGVRQTSGDLISGTVNVCVWSKNGEYLLATRNSSPYLIAWPITFAGASASFGTSFSASGLNDDPLGLDMSPDGLDLAIGGLSTPFVYTMPFDEINGSFGTLTAATGGAHGITAGPVKWTPDKAFVIISHANFIGDPEPWHIRQWNGLNLLGPIEPPEENRAATVRSWVSDVMPFDPTLSPLNALSNQEAFEMPVDNSNF